MIRIATTLVVLATLATFLRPAFAIYKCEVNGKVTYSDATCPGGILLDLNSAPAMDSSVEDRQLEQEKITLKQLEKERHRREAKDQKELKKANRSSATRRRRCDALALQQKHAAEDIPKSIGKAHEKARTKLRRITEAYEAKCGRWREREMDFAR